MTKKLFDDTPSQTTRQATRRQYAEKRMPTPEKQTPGLKHLAIADSSMSLKEMLQRTQRGLPISSGRQPVFNGEKLLPDWKKLDLIDRARIQELAKADVDAKREKRDKKKRELDELFAQAQAEKEKARQEALNNPEKPQTGA